MNPREEKVMEVQHIVDQARNLGNRSFKAKRYGGECPDPCLLLKMDLVERAEGRFVALQKPLDTTPMQSSSARRTQLFTEIVLPLTAPSKIRRRR